MVAKAHARACLIICCFVSKDRVWLINAFITYVRPLVEYASCEWSPGSVGLIRKSRRYRNASLKNFRVINVLGYHEQLAFLDLESLELRRLKADPCTTYIKYCLILLTLTSITFCC